VPFPLVLSNGPPAERLGDVYQEQVVVRASGHDGNATSRERFGEDLRIVDHRRRVLPERRL